MCYTELRCSLVLVCLVLSPQSVTSSVPPSPECNTTFVGVFVESSTVQLQWNPVDASAPECPDNVQYCVSYRCCRATSWYLTRCTANTSIEIQLNDSEGGCEIENSVVFSVQVLGSNYLSTMTVNLDSNTELVVAEPGAVVQIQAQGTCDVLGEICIAPKESNAKCYTTFDYRKVQERNFTLTACSNFLLCIQITAAMNTLYTVLCSRLTCGTISSVVGTTSKLIVAAPPSQPQRPCIYYNGTHIVLCAELPFSHLTITALTIQVMTACDRTFEHFIMTTDLCRPLPISDIVNMTLDCQLANFSITTHSDAGVSLPSPPATVNGNEANFCSCVAEKIPAGVARFVRQNGTSLFFQVLMPTDTIPPYLSINFCSDTFGTTITSASGQSNSIQQMWNMEFCDFESGQALISLNMDNLLPTAGENYTVIFNLSFHFDGVVDLCYLQLQVDNITVLDQGFDHSRRLLLLGWLAFIIIPIYTALINWYWLWRRKRARKYDKRNGK